MASDLEKKARKILAAEYEADGRMGLAEAIRSSAPSLAGETRAIGAPLRAIVAALRAAPATAGDEPRLPPLPKPSLPADTGSAIERTHGYTAKQMGEYALEALRAAPAAAGVPEGRAVAFLDLGVGGYMDVGTDLSDEQLAQIPKGRHMLGIIGTYGVDGYVPAAPEQRVVPVAAEANDTMVDRVIDALGRAGLQPPDRPRVQLILHAALTAASEQRAAPCSCHDHADAICPEHPKKTAPEQRAVPTALYGPHGSVAFTADGRTAVKKNCPPPSWMFPEDGDQDGKQEVPAIVEQSAMSRHTRAMLLNIIWHHQGSGSTVGQPLRAMLGIGKHDRLSDEQLAEAKWIEGLLVAGDHDPAEQQGAGSEEPTGLPPIDPPEVPHA
ncbi:hypothetical protein [Stenotrophomonas sp. MMGLT7]|uniref:hypothetical protein n=1 Tax=Stenotrophomonas sp. MMGLT7 TaxID=2901227 RepID=UPI001E2BA68D|nr:hypothetical protein [Stenotrophomonas sp. MMGLT7]MCD7096900.1 hypothetical protein [Stenotrophomonas sp. MMGLT7]